MPALDTVSRDVYAKILDDFPTLERARDLQQVREAVVKAAPPWLPNISDVQVELSKLYIKPGKHVRVLFHFFGKRANDDPEEHVWAVAKIPHRETLEKTRRKASKGKPSRSTGNSLALWDHGLTLEPFTSDDDLAHVAQLTDRKWAVPYFQALIERFPIPADTQIEAVDIDPFKYLPGKRIVLQYQLHHSEGTLQLFAKHYDGEQGRLAAEIQNHLSRALEGIRGTAVVPRVYHYDIERQVSFQQAWPGESIRKADADQRRSLWPRLLGATRALHSVTLPRGTHQRMDARQVLFKVRKDVNDITALLPQMETQMNEAQKLLERVLMHQTPQRNGFLHGSLLPSQILLGNDSIAFIDFDETAEGSPLYDICELLTSFLFEDWRGGRSTQDIRGTWRQGLDDFESIYEHPPCRTLAAAYTLTFLMNRTHQHLKKLRRFPPSGLQGLVDLLGTFATELA